MGANEFQVGGTHYKNSAGYEHWDFCIDTPVDYLVGCATKYVARHSKKNGVEDLKKALHYTNKIMEAFNANRLVPPNPSLFYCTSLERFAVANGLSDLEIAITRQLVSWSGLADLERARDGILLLMHYYDMAPTAEPPVPQPVPLTEENHHAPRVGGYCLLGPSCKTPSGTVCDEPGCDWTY